MPSSTPAADREIGVRVWWTGADRWHPDGSPAWSGRGAAANPTGDEPGFALACRDVGDEPAAGGPAPGSHHLLFLALFLLLGGVFALLTSYARLDQDKIDRVLASLEERFGGGALGLPVERERVGDPRDAALETLARSDPEAVDSPLLLKGRREGGLALSLEEDRLFDREGRIPRARWVLLSRFAQAAREEGVRIAVLAPRPVPPGRLDEGRLARLDRLRARLVALGAPAESVLAGVGDGRDRRWRVVLWPKERSLAVGDAADGAR